MGYVIFFLPRVLIRRWIFNYSFRHLTSPYLLFHHLALPYITFRKDCKKWKLQTIYLVYGGGLQTDRKCHFFYPFLYRTLLILFPLLTLNKLLTLLKLPALLLVLTLLIFLLPCFSYSPHITLPYITLPHLTSLTLLTLLTLLLLIPLFTLLRGGGQIDPHFF